MRERGEAVGEAVLRAHRHRVAAQGGFPCLERGLALVKGGLAGVELFLAGRRGRPPCVRALSLELHAQGCELLLDGADPLFPLGEAPLRLGFSDGAPCGGELLREPVGTGVVLELGEPSLARCDRRCPLAEGGFHRLDLALDLGVGRVATRRELAREPTDLLEVEPERRFPLLVDHRKSVARLEPQGKLPKSLQAGADSLRPSDRRAHGFARRGNFPPCHQRQGVDTMRIRRLLVLIGAAAVSALAVAAASQSRATAAPSNTSLPSISGSARDGSVLTASHGSWTGNPTSYAYQWLRCDAQGGNCASIAGATSQRYTVQTADVGARLRVQVTAANSSGSGVAESRPTGVVQATGTAPKTTSPPTISGTPQEGSTLTVSPGSWGGSPAPSLSYQWERCVGTGGGCTAIPGAT